MHNFDNFDRDFDRFEQNFDRNFNRAVKVGVVWWVICAVLSLALTAVVIWGIVMLVLHFT